MADDPIHKLMMCIKSANETYARERTHPNDCGCRGCAYVRTMVLFVEKYEEERGKGVN